MPQDVVPSRRGLLALIGAGAAFAGLAGCSTPASPTFDLSAAKDFPARTRGGLAGQLIIYEPVALAVYDSDRVVVKSANQSLSYLPGAQWADRLPRLVQTRLIQSFENAHRFKSVGRPGDQITATMVLNWEIRSFEIEEQSRQAVIEIAVKTVAQGSGRIERAQLFKTAIPVSMIDAAGATGALDEALKTILLQIVAWGAR